MEDVLKIHPPPKKKGEYKGSNTEVVNQTFDDCCFKK